MVRWKLTVEYDGSGFSGWQRQVEQRSIQQTLEDAIEKFSGETVTLHVAGRTDAGVHAFANVAHFDLQKDCSSDTVRDALNFHVRPHKVVVLSAQAMPVTFHARFSALARSYNYYILNRRTPSALIGHRTWHVQRSLDVQAMQKAATHLIGYHDFSTFRAQNCQSTSPLKTLDQLTIDRDDDEIMFFVKARSFLYHQVRNMVGTLVQVGSAQWSFDQFMSAFKARDRRAGGPTAPSDGLFFKEVSYPDEYT